MSKRMFVISVWVCTAVILFSGLSYAGPKGAKAIFDSGEGPSTTVSAAPVQRAPESVSDSRQKYVGISYELLLLSDDGQIRKVSKNRTFRSGERLVMRVMTNRSGNLKIYNIGPTGNTNVLYDEYVDAYTATQVPRNSNFRFVGDAGTETLLIMLQDGGRTAAAPVTAGAYQTQAPPPPAPTPVPPPPPPSYPAPSAQPGYPTGPSSYPPPSYDQSPPPPPPSSPPPSYGSQPYYPPASSDASALPPPPAVMASNIEGSKRIKGSKDIVVEDRMESSFAVVSPRNNWKPVQTGGKDIVVESASGTNYGVVPVSAVSDGGILSLSVKLKHR